MPQGPTSLGCEGCRAQKKKCDLMQPTCSRCQRLRMKCIGCGQHRYKFLWDQKRSNRKGWPDASPQPVPSPSNRTTSLQQAVVSKLQAPRDIRYHIDFVYSKTLVELPKRLGSNEAMDAAVAALLARHDETSMRKDQSDPQAVAVVKYNRALLALRAKLADANEATTTETICAVMLLNFCQARFDNQFTFFWSPHGQGIRQLMRMRNYPVPRNSFEQFVFGPLYATLIMQSIGNPEICLDVWEFRRLEAVFKELASTAPPFRQWVQLIQTAKLMVRAKSAILHGYCLYSIASEAEELQKAMQSVLDDLHDQLQTSAGVDGDRFSEQSIRTAYCSRQYGVALATFSILLSARRALSPQNADLQILATKHCQESLRICRDAQIYRPLGAVWTIHTLICAWCATSGYVLKEKIEGELLDYQRDAMGPRAEFPMDQLRLLERRLCLLE